MAILKSCLCGSVETGSRMVALLSCINAAYMSVAPFDIKSQLDRICTLSNNTSVYCHYSKDDVYTKLLFMKVFWVSSSLISSILLVLGIHLRKRFLLLPWIMWNGFLTGVFLVFLTPSRSQGSLLTLVFFAWTELCVISHYQNLRDEILRGPRGTSVSLHSSVNIDRPIDVHSGGPLDLIQIPPALPRDASLNNFPPPPYEECGAGRDVIESKCETPPPSYQECATSSSTPSLTIVNECQGGAASLPSQDEPLAIKK